MNWIHDCCRKLFMAALFVAALGALSSARAGCNCLLAHYGDLNTGDYSAKEVKSFSLANTLEHWVLSGDTLGSCQSACQDKGKNELANKDTVCAKYLKGGGSPGEGLGFGLYASDPTANPTTWFLSGARTLYTCQPKGPAVMNAVNGINGVAAVVGKIGSYNLDPSCKSDALKTCKAAAGNDSNLTQFCQKIFGSGRK